MTDPTDSPDRTRRIYDVALSFAGEDRRYVEAVAAALAKLGLRVFYDDYEKVALWGKDLYEHLDYVYGQAARYCVLFASKHYVDKVWTTHERKSAQARALEEHHEYVLPARFDGTDIPGVRPTVGYIDLNGLPPEDFARIIFEKVGRHEVGEFFPPTPDRLFEVLGIEDDVDTERVLKIAVAFYKALRHMTVDERTAVGAVLAFGCPGELPEYVHVSLDLLRRYTGLAPAQLLELLEGVRSLGFGVEVREAGHPDLPVTLRPGDLDVRVEWFSGLGIPENDSTEIAMAVVRTASSHFCEDHGLEMIKRLDFVRLSTSHDGPVIVDE